MGQLDAVLLIVDNFCNTIGQLEQSILAKAFRGELVPQDPSDEPASVLLERIQAERAKQEAEAKTATARKSTGKTTGQRSRKALAARFRVNSVGLARVRVVGRVESDRYKKEG